MAQLEDLHEWVSFEDPDEQRTWIFDVTFLTSNYTCIFGRGCPGVLTEPAPELVHGCCSYGAHLTGKKDRRHVEKRAERLTPDQWQFRKEAAKRGGPIKVNRDGETVTRLVDGACIFLNRAEFAGGAGCALHRAALEAGERFMDWKPEVCWQVPVRRVDDTDPYGHVTSTVREWKRRDWGDGGFEFHWWCTDDPLAFVGDKPVYREMRDELIEMCGRKPYMLLVGHIEARMKANGTGRGRPKASSSTTTYLPHPALRK
jgi:hypothetical protein